MQNKFPDIIDGQFIKLRRTTVEDATLIYKWRSGASGRFMRQPDGYSVASQKSWIKNRGDNEGNYMIIDKATDIAVGTIGIYDVNDADKVSNVGRLLLDDAYLVKSNPYGLESLFLTYNFVFNTLKFRKITGDILAENHAMFKLQLFLGMKQEGYLTNHVFLNDKYYDLYIMSIFKEDFSKRFTIRVAFLLKPFKYL